MLIIDPTPPDINIYAIEGQGISKLTVSPPFDWESILNKVRSKKIIGSIAYVLHHGGLDFPETVTKVQHHHLKQIKNSIKFSPSFNKMTYEAFLALETLAPHLDHFILSETAFFTSMPDFATLYAIPYEYSSHGIRRFGGDGLCHNWVCSQPELKKFERIISIHLNTHTTIAAIRNGMAIESSMGLSELEGLPSQNSSGDIDPSIVLLLRSKGHSSQEIYQILTTESGFNILTQDHTLPYESHHDGSYNLVYDIFLNRLLEQIGCALAALGGINALVFSGENIREHLSFIKSVMKSLQFLGIKETNNPLENDNFFEFSENVSDIHIFGLNYNRGTMLQEIVRK